MVCGGDSVRLFKCGVRYVSDPATVDVNEVYRPMKPVFDPKSLSGWLRTVSTTEDDELDCRQTSESVAVAVDAAVAAGRDIREVRPEIAVHLQHCLNCRELFETLVALAREQE